MPQTSVSLSAAVAKVGMLSDTYAAEADIISALATEDILVGEYVEITLSSDGKQFKANRPAYGSSTLGKGGIALLESMQEASTSTAGTKGVIDSGRMFSVLRKGRAFALCDSGMTEVSSFMQSAKVRCPDTTATNRGKFTTAAAATTSDAQIVDTASAGTRCQFVRVIDKANSLCEVEIG